MKENNWYIDLKSNFAHWYIYGDIKNSNLFWVELKSLFDTVFFYGSLSKLLYTHKYIIEPAKLLVSDLKFSNNNKCHGLFKVGNDLYLNSLIDLYQMGRVTSKETNISNIELILSEIQYNARDEINHSNFSLLQLSYDIDKEANRFTIGLHVNSDVFFPYVLCPWKWKKKYDDKNKMGPGINELDFKIHGFDNRELSFRNGSRLNLLVKGLKSYVDSLDDIQWDFYQTEHWLGYHKMVTDAGIILDEK